MSEPTPELKDQYLTVKETAEYLRLGEATIREYARTRELPAAKVGGKWLFKRSLIDEWYLHRIRNNEGTE